MKNIEYPTITSHTLTKEKNVSYGVQTVAEKPDLKQGQQIEENR